MSVLEFIEIPKQELSASGAAFGLKGCGCAARNVERDAVACGLAPQPFHATDSSCATDQRYLGIPIY